MKKFIAIFIIFNGYTNICQAMNPFQILNIQPTATEKEIFAAYSQKVMTAHNDNRGMDARLSELANARQKASEHARHYHDTTPAVLARGLQKMMAQSSQQTPSKTDPKLESMANELMNEQRLNNIIFETALKILTSK